MTTTTNSSLSLVDDIRFALEESRRSMTIVLDLLLAPYRDWPVWDPDLALGNPRFLPVCPYENPLRELAGVALRSGGGAAPLLRVVRDADLVDRVVDDYLGGLHDMTGVCRWRKDLADVRKQMLANVDLALAACPRWEGLLVVPPPKEPASGASTKELLGPEAAALLLGIDVTGMRARIRRGQAGPWKKVAGKWVIRREEFLKFHGQGQPKADGSESPSRGIDVRDLFGAGSGRRRSRRGGGGESKAGGRRR